MLLQQQRQRQRFSQEALHVVDIYDDFDLFLVHDNHGLFECGLMAGVKVGAH